MVDTGNGSLEQAKDTPPEAKQSLPKDEHWLKSKSAGESQIEQLAHRIEARRAERILVIFAVRVNLLRTCRDICKSKNYNSTNSIYLDDLEGLHAEAKAKVEADSQSTNPIRLFSRRMGFRNEALQTLQVLEKALMVVNEVQDDHNNWFYFQDFSFYYTKVESQWPWLRSPPSVAFLIIFCFYLFTVIFFCHIVDDADICPDDPTDQNRFYYGWLSSLYFASTTMSTVGYGDLSVGKDDRWRLLVGVLYMIASLLVAILAFGAAADHAFAPLSGLLGESWHKLNNYMKGNTSGKLLYQQIRHVKIVMIFEVILQFVLLNLLGVFVSRYFANHTEIESQQWNWMTSLYWAVQTTTTIGYGDLDMSFDLRWFQVFYLTLSTYFVSNALGKVASLLPEIERIRRQYAWKRREVSKGLIKELESHEHDDSVDQYEFAIASLLTLGTISANDLAPIMDKYREMAGDSGYIQISEAAEKEAVDDPPPIEEEIVDLH